MGYAVDVKEKALISTTDKERLLLKASKYVTRFCEAMMILILKLLKLQIELNEEGELLYLDLDESQTLFCYPPTTPNVPKECKMCKEGYCKMYILFQNLYNEAVRLNKYRKGLLQDQVSNEEISRFSAYDFESIVYENFIAFHPEHKSILF
jgi:hypothetical protein